MAKKYFIFLVDIKLTAWYPGPQTRRARRPRAAKRPGKSPRG
jgi:hypothetical protein